jgi:hypothetical protein
METEVLMVTLQWSKLLDGQNSYNDIFLNTHTHINTHRVDKRGMRESFYFL